jgi:predicted acyltransferase
MSATAVKLAELPGNSISQPSARLISLDVFRGLTVAGMVLVTDPGTYSAVYWPLLHAQWDNPTPTDMIFPSFLFIVGMAMTFSFASRIERGANRGTLAWHLLRRSVVIFVLGLVINGFPDYDWRHLRIPGVLQRIALCYLCGGLIYLTCDIAASKSKQSRKPVGNRVIAGVIVALLAGYWALLKLVPVPGFGAGRLDSLGNLGAYIDRAVLGTNHMWVWGLTPGYGVTFDPEGLLSTLPAIATLLIGALAGDWMRPDRSGRRKALGLAAAGIALVIAGWMLHPLLPLNKKIWTSTFTLFAAGVSLLAFSLLYVVVDLRRWRAWTYPALILGTNAILAFAISSILTTLTDRIHVPATTGAALSLHQWLHQYGFASWLPPVNASLAFAIAIVLLNVAILWPLYRRRIFLRV